jgi:predicted metal-dependent phosphoesterase TrpH
MKLDCHLHTAASGDAVTTIDQLAEQVARAAIDVVCITDHNVTAAAVAAAERGIGARVIVGEEIRTWDGDLIGLFLTQRVPYVLPTREAAELIRAQGGLVYLPHPFDTGRPSLRWVAEELCAAGLADVVEVFNAKIADQSMNDRAAELAARFGLPGAAGSDAHDPDGIGAAYAEVPDFDGPADFLAALRHAKITGEFRPHAPRYPRQGDQRARGASSNLRP